MSPEIAIHDFGCALRLAPSKPLSQMIRERMASRPVVSGRTISRNSDRHDGRAVLLRHETWPRNSW